MLGGNHGHCHLLGRGALVGGGFEGGGGAGHHVQADVAAHLGSLVVLLGQHRADETDQRLAVGEDVDDVGAAADLPLEPLLGRADLQALRSLGLPVAPRSYRAAKRGPPAPRVVDDAAVINKLRWIRTAGPKGRPLPEVLYGRRKLTAWLARNGFPGVSKHTVDRLMRQEGQRGLVRGRKVRTTTPARTGLSRLGAEAQERLEDQVHVPLAGLAQPQQPQRCGLDAALQLGEVPVFPPWSGRAALRPRGVPPHQGILRDVEERDQLSGLSAARSGLVTMGGLVPRMGHFAVAASGVS
jgi:hypothetical protein